MSDGASRGSGNPFAARRRGADVETSEATVPLGARAPFDDAETVALGARAPSADPFLDAPTVSASQPRLDAGEATLPPSVSAPVLPATPPSPAPAPQVPPVPSWSAFSSRDLSQSTLPPPKREPMALVDPRSGAFDRGFVQAVLVGVLAITLIAMLLSAR